MAAIDVAAQIDAHQTQHLDRVRAFIRQPSISADGTGIPAMADLVAATIREVGGEASAMPTAGHPIVLGRLDAGAKRTLLFYGMYDVQPVEGETWMVPPFAGEIVDLPKFGPSMVARGVFNSKGPMAGFFNALDAYRATGQRPPVNVVFLIEGEEELGSRNLPAFVAAHRDALKADAAYFAFFGQDDRGIPMLYLGVKGIIFMEWIARGGAWGGPEKRMIHGSNAVWIGSPTWRLVQALASAMGRNEQILVEGFYDDVAALDADEDGLVERLAEVFDEKVILDQHDVRRFKIEGHGGASAWARAPRRAGVHRRGDQPVAGLSLGADPVEESGGAGAGRRDPRSGHRALRLATIGGERTDVLVLERAEDAVCDGRAGTRRPRPQPQRVRHGGRDAPV